MTAALPSCIAFIGFGEVGRIFARDLRTAGVSEIRAFDIAFADAESAQLRNARAQGVEVCSDAPTAVRGAPLVISAVTAGSALDAARSVVPGIGGDAFFLDVNSVSPSIKRDAATVVNGAGGRYVESAVMSSVPPHGLQTPMLLGGRHAAAFAPLGEALGLAANVYSDKIGAASSVKMCRSVMIKGLEALVMECLVSARAYGVEADVLRSLSDTMPNTDWEQLAGYMIRRSLQHGRRRAEEMREVAKTVAETGCEPLMSLAIAARQDWAAGIGRTMGKPAEGDGLGTILETIRSTMSAGMPSTS
ncbi:MAG TPA: DUF1932 domain-containing protein [Azospirillum sp.]|nr:DUF1932 domain-containing protein [Azospirillum sp.]